MGVEFGLGKQFGFPEAVKFLEGKTALTKEEYQELSEECRAKAFTVSGYTSLEVLQEFLDTLTKAVEDGTTLEQFREDMNGFLEEHGYEGINPWKAATIFRTNVQSAYQAGHYKSMTDPTVKKLRPYWRYKTAGDGRVRDTHAMMDGRVYRADDPIWDVWFPPNGFGCRCAVTSLSERQVKERGYTVSKEPPRSVDYSTGEIRYCYPDKGFSNNPGKECWKPDLSGMDGELKKLFREREKRKP